LTFNLLQRFLHLRLRFEKLYSIALSAFADGIYS
jgi:hypothetical protein